MRPRRFGVAHGVQHPPQFQQGVGDDVGQRGGVGRPKGLKPALEAELRCRQVALCNEHTRQLTHRDRDGRILVDAQRASPQLQGPGKVAVSYPRRPAHPIGHVAQPAQRVRQLQICRMPLLLECEHNEQPVLGGVEVPLKFGDICGDRWEIQLAKSGARSFSANAVSP